MGASEHTAAGAAAAETVAAEDQGDIVGSAPAPDGPVSIIDYSERIPNNVGLATDRKLQRALESWQPKFLDWWSLLGPALPTRDVYLRTATAIGRDGWANWARVPMAQYRWGIFLSERTPGKTIGFGQHKGEPAWQEVPGEYRADLRRLLVIQGDTEPASVEQQRHLGATAPSLYDLRNLFQVNVEEGRHLWAMVYLLHAYFGRDGREEAEQLLGRHSGDTDSPRILGAFNEATTDWLSFFMFTYFTDRDGKYQLGTLKESGFDPLARTCEFMLREEAHHMFVGTTGVQRTVRRTAQLLARHGDDARLWDHGAIPLAVIQKYLNFQFSVSLDLFGSETSSNVAAYYTAGLKGRWMETRRHDDHVLNGLMTDIPVVRDGVISAAEVPLLTALNLDLRNEYVQDCARGLRKWNAELEQAGLEQRLALPHEGFNRRVGAYAGQHVSPDGEMLTAAEWDRQEDSWLPTDDDRAGVAALMTARYDPGEFAGWIAPPSVGINELPVEYDYVRF
jgi:benzoyl-CoA 2,3-dioxygenase component B